MVGWGTKVSAKRSISTFFQWLLQNRKQSGVVEKNWCQQRRHSKNDGGNQTKDYLLLDSHFDKPGIESFPKDR